MYRWYSSSLWTSLPTLILIPHICQVPYNRGPAGADTFPCHRGIIRFLIIIGASINRRLCSHRCELRGIFSHLWNRERRHPSTHKTTSLRGNVVNNIWWNKLSSFITEKLGINPFISPHQSKSAVQASLPSLQLQQRIGPSHFKGALPCRSPSSLPSWGSYTELNSWLSHHHPQTVLQFFFFYFLTPDVSILSFPTHLLTRFSCSKKTESLRTSMTSAFLAHRYFLVPKSSFRSFDTAFF